MNDAEARLSRCFLAAIPGLRLSDIPAASVQTVEQWDSVASVTLVALIEEEFGIQIDLEALDELDSYGAILNYVTRLSAS